jgi:hypothetical protein
MLHRRVLTEQGGIADAHAVCQPQALRPPDRRNTRAIHRGTKRRKNQGPLSSSPDFQGPRFGKALNAQLREALWKTEVLILCCRAEQQKIPVH